MTTFGGFATLSAYRSARAGVIREHLFEMLGPVCAECGCDLTTTAWEVNHVYRRDWKPRKLSRYRRHLRYLREAKVGDVNLLCSDCNQVYRPKPRPQLAAAQSADPF